VSSASREQKKQSASSNECAKEASKGTIVHLAKATEMSWNNERVSIRKPTAIQDSSVGLIGQMMVDSHCFLRTAHQRKEPIEKAPFRHILQIKKRRRSRRRNDERISLRKPRKVPCAICFAAFFAGGWMGRSARPSEATRSKE